MASKTITFLLLLLLLFLCSFSSGEFEDFNNRMNLDHSPHKGSDLDEEIFTDGSKREIRKFLMIDKPDYEDPVANRKHEPQKPGIGKP